MKFTRLVEIHDYLDFETIKKLLEELGFIVSYKEEFLVSGSFPPLYAAQFTIEKEI